MDESMITDREWRVQGAYGRSYVEEHRAYGGDWDSGTYGVRVDARSAKHAREIASAINSAYRAGRRDGRKAQEQEREQETVQCEAHEGVHFAADNCLHPHLTDPATRAKVNSDYRLGTGYWRTGKVT